MKKYVKFTKDLPHYQNKKWNGTEGRVEMKSGDVGIYNVEKNTYAFSEVNGVITEYTAHLLLCLEGKFTTFHDAIHTTKFYDEEHKQHVERFEIRLIQAKSVLDVDWAWIQFCAAEENRLSIKLSLMRLNKQIA